VLSSSEFRFCALRNARVSTCTHARKTSSAIRSLARFVVEEASETAATS